MQAGGEQILPLRKMYALPQRVPDPFLLPSIRARMKQDLILTSGIFLLKIVLAGPPLSHQERSCSTVTTVIMEIIMMRITVWL